MVRILIWIGAAVFATLLVTLRTFSPPSWELVWGLDVGAMHETAFQSREGCERAADRLLAEFSRVDHRDLSGHMFHACISRD